jgi:DNA-binding winged helix-turn-helix (wHTH) protein/tetratricopeptide (TPR) repeat protein
VTESNILSFDGWTLNRSSSELTRDGATQRLPPQPLAMLVELLEHPGEVVTRERLVQVLWPKGIVDFDNSLNAVVRRLRAVLGDDSEAPRYIETLPRIGYRFIGVVGARVSEAVAPAAKRRLPRWLWAVPAALLVVAVAWGFWMRSDAPTRDAQSTTIDPKVRTTNRRAYELYLDGKFNVSRRDIVGGGIAIERYQAALEEDPYFAEAWAALAEAYGGMGITQRTPLRETMEKARSAALRAIELDPNLAAGHSALAMVKLQYDLDLPGAEQELKAGIAADAHYSRLWHTYGLLRGYQGRMDESFEFMGRARELEPMTLLYAYSYANNLYQSRQFDQAIEFVRPLLASQPRFDQARDVMIRSLVAKGDIKAALEQVPLRHFEIPTLSDQGLVYAHAGMRTEAQAQIDKLERRRSEGYATSYELAIIHAALGNMDDACTALRRVLEDHSMTIGWMKLDPRMDPMRKQACFKEVSAKLYAK